MSRTLADLDAVDTGGAVDLRRLAQQRMSPRGPHPMDFSKSDSGSPQDLAAKEQEAFLGAADQRSPECESPGSAKSKPPTATSPHPAEITKTNSWSNKDFSPKVGKSGPLVPPQADFDKLFGPSEPAGTGSDSELDVKASELTEYPEPEPKPEAATVVVRPTSIRGRRPQSAGRRLAPLGPGEIDVRDDERIPRSPDPHSPLRASPRPSSPSRNTPSPRPTTYSPTAMAAAGCMFPSNLPMPEPLRRPNNLTVQLHPLDGDGRSPLHSPGPLTPSSLLRRSPHARPSSPRPAPVTPKPARASSPLPTLEGVSEKPELEAHSVQRRPSSPRPSSPRPHNRTQPDLSVSISDGENIRRSIVCPASLLESGGRTSPLVSPSMANRASASRGPMVSPRMGSYRIKTRLADDDLSSGSSPRVGSEVSP
eukprot:CAMPEP_0114539582 /NCGR_PEP_ID=MMETSP0114-20121206/312_1 /TAXON_ID=31324 /ORGANISM="Goniomonas sp, Strain m" /LENGTH=422 /DNA_ID=CAMNT_0001723689 /DNA_START=25 /DNA_END=1293 /DNA_ORIENTATION=+